jgi:excisionase family DNA binding protein
MDEHMDEGTGSCDTEQVGSGGEEVLTAREAARLLKVSADLVYEAANRGEMPHRRLGRRMLFSRVALVGWLRAEAGRAVAERAPRRVRRAAG